MVVLKYGLTNDGFKTLSSLGYKSLLKITCSFLIANNSKYEIKSNILQPGSKL